MNQVASFRTSLELLRLQGLPGPTMEVMGLACHGAGSNGIFPKARWVGAPAGRILFKGGGLWDEEKLQGLPQERMY